MNRSSFNWLPIVVLISIAAFTFWIERNAQNFVPTKKVKATGIDFWSENFTLSRFAPDGKLLNVLVAKRMTHESSDDSGKLQLPTMRYAGAPETIIKAREAEMDDKGGKVELIGNVQIDRSADNKPNGKGPMHVRSERMTVYPDLDKAEGHVPVRIERGKDVVTGDTYQTDGKTGISVLRGRVRATIHREDS